VVVFWLADVGRVRFFRRESFSGAGETIPQGNLTGVGCGSRSTVTGGTLAPARVISRFWRGGALAGILESSRELSWVGWGLWLGWHMTGDDGSP
jgi:hypothetical protein